jgi:histone-lysine N-methyltransferase SETMAR
MDNFEIRVLLRHY